MILVLASLVAICAIAFTLGVIVGIEYAERRCERRQEWDARRRERELRQG